MEWRCASTTASPNRDRNSAQSSMTARPMSLSRQLCRHHHIRPKLALVRLRIGLGELGGAIHDGSHLRIDGLQLVLADELALEQAPAHLLDRIVLLAHLLDLL